MMPLDESPRSTAVDTIDRLRWNRTAAVERAIVLGLLLAAIGTLTSRIDLILLAIPLLCTAAIGIDRRPIHEASLALRVRITQLDESSGGSAFRYQIIGTVNEDVELIHVRVTPQGAPPHELILAPHQDTMAVGYVPIVRTGRQVVLEISGRMIGPDGGWLTCPSSEHTAEQTVSAVTTPLRAIPLPHHLTGLTGAHASSRRGDGGEFRDVHPYAPGDSLRRIDWRATARRSNGLGDLYVRRTNATADATVMLVIDSRDDVPELVAGWSGEQLVDAGVHAMDLTREAATSLARFAIGAGDRVGLIDLASNGRALPPGGGKRHLERLLSRIADSTPLGARVSRRRAPIIPAGAIVYVISTLLDEEVNAVALFWKAAGHRVVWVDVLPSPRLVGSSPYTRAAHRLLMAERQRHLTAVRRHGGEIVRWQEDEGNRSRVVAFRALTQSGRRRT